MRRLGIISVLVSSITSNSFAATPSGIPRELARERAQLISDIHYDLRFGLIPGGVTEEGEEQLRFQLKAPAPLLLDYRDGSVLSLVINGLPGSVVLESGHLRLRKEDLHEGENDLTITFVSSVAPAGKAITRYLDRDDDREYIYTLFVPMDASMAFPCFDQPDLKASVVIPK